MPDGVAIQMLLRRVAWRLSLWRAVRRLLRVTIVLLAAVSGALVASHFALGREGSGLVVIGIVGGGFFFAVRGFRRVSKLEAARIVDSTFGLGERLVTAAGCVDEPAGAMSGLLLQDAARWCARVDVRRVPRESIGREALAVVLGIATAGAVWSFQPARLATPWAAGNAEVGSPSVASEKAVTRASIAETSAGHPAPERPTGGLRLALGLDPSPATAPQALPSGSASPLEERAPLPIARGQSMGEDAATRARAQETGLSNRSASVEHASPAGPRSARPWRPEPRPDASLPTQKTHRAIAGIHAGEAQPGPGMAAGAAADSSGAVSVGVGGPHSIGPAPDSARASTGSPATAPPLERSVSAPLGTGAAFTRTAVPPALREFVLRYFRELSSLQQEDPS
jgi:hypothetical protein